MPIKNLVTIESPGAEDETQIAVNGTAVHPVHFPEGMFVQAMIDAATVATLPPPGPGRDAAVAGIARSALIQQYKDLIAEQDARDIASGNARVAGLNSEMEIPDADLV